MAGKDNDLIQLTRTDGIRVGYRGLNVTGECVGFTVVNPTYAAGGCSAVALCAKRTTGDSEIALITIA